MPAQNINIFGDQMNRTAFFITIVFAFTNCISVPRIARRKEPNCNLITKKLKLGIVGSDKPYLKATRDTMFGENIPSGCNGSAAGAAACAAIFATLSAASLVVSGSVVVVGNTVHWLEKEGRCSPAYEEEEKDIFVKKHLEENE